jgi:hypothetical protein
MAQVAHQQHYISTSAVDNSCMWSLWRSGDVLYAVSAAGIGYCPSSTVTCEFNYSSKLKQSEGA